jgi:hypothetical protein
MPKVTSSKKKYINLASFVEDRWKKCHNQKTSKAHNQTKLKLLSEI